MVFQGFIGIVQQDIKRNAGSEDDVGRSMQNYSYWLAFLFIPLPSYGKFSVIPGEESAGPPPALCELRHGPKRFLHFLYPERAVLRQAAIYDIPQGTVTVPPQVVPPLKHTEAA